MFIMQETLLLKQRPQKTQPGQNLVNYHLSSIVIILFVGEGRLRFLGVNKKDTVSGHWKRVRPSGAGLSWSHPGKS